MNLASTTQKVIGLVEEMTGVPVVVIPDPSLQTLAAVKIARHSAPAHVVTYNPLMGAGTDYAVCVLACGDPRGHLEFASRNAPSPVQP